ncbi:MAG: hypothetical protein Q4C98_10630, partial [Capnocytophaga sp.]|nr:hypothetical protein [Capnocytophaga sp.]
VYRICEVLNPTNCDTATATVVVSSATISAQDDNFGIISGSIGGVVGNVLTDNGNGTDTLGTVSATVANVAVSVVTPATPISGGNGLVPTLDTATGNVTVPVNTPAGTYTIT